MGGILQVDTIQNNNATTLITQTNSTTLTFGVSGQNIVIPSGVTFNTASATVTLPSTISTTTINTSTINVTTVVLAAGAVGTPSLTTSGDTNTGIFFPSADTIAFTEGGAEAMRINSDGNLALVKNIGLGGATPSTSGTGITFPASASDSTNANTLDDYEEGTWTPTLTATSGSANYNAQAANYAKVGSLVVLNFWNFGSSRNTLSGDVSITLPFAMNTGGFRTATILISNSLTLTGQLVGRLISPSTSFQLEVQNNGSISAFPASGIPLSTFEMYCSLSYRTD